MLLDKVIQKSIHRHQSIYIRPNKKACSAFTVKYFHHFSFSYLFIIQICPLCLSSFLSFSVWFVVTASQAHVFIDLVNVQNLVDIPVARPRLRHLELVERHEQLHGERRSIRVPQLQAALNTLVRRRPVALNVVFEGLSEYGIELLNVLLQANNVRVESEHVVDTLVLEGLNVDRFVLGQLN